MEIFIGEKKPILQNKFSAAIFFLPFFSASIKNNFRSLLEKIHL